MGTKLLPIEMANRLLKEVSEPDDITHEKKCYFFFTRW